MPIIGGGSSSGATGTPVDGWVSDSTETWTFVSATSFKIVGADLSAKYTPGTRLKLTQTTLKYFVVTAVAFAVDTTVTITGGSDFALANAAITGPFHSYEGNPQGYPNTFNYTSGAAGWASFTTNVAQFSVNGRTCSVYYRLIGTSNATTATAALPIPSAQSANFLPQAAGFFDGSTTQIGSAFCSAASVITFAIGSPPNSAGWANVGAKNITVVLDYEI